MFLNYSHISHIFLDVRGTILHPVEDLPASSTLLSQVAKCLQQGIHIALVSGCSRKTIETLIVQPLKDVNSCNSGSTSGCLYIYAETGAKGYCSNSDFSLEPLPNYDNHTFNETESMVILKIIKEQSEIHHIEGKVEMRSGQINFYCVDDRQMRLDLAKDINICLKDLGLNNVSAHVPTSKTVIDISLGCKTTAVKDMIKRTNLQRFDKAVLISDSLQKNGSDAEILGVMPTVNAVHVGMLDAPLCEGISYREGGPNATEMILSYISSLG